MKHGQILKNCLMKVTFIPDFKEFNRRESRQLAESLINCQFKLYFKSGHTVTLKRLSHDIFWPECEPLLLLKSL